MKRLKTISLFTEIISVRPIALLAVLVLLFDLIYVNLIFKYPKPVYKDPSANTLEVTGKIRGMGRDKSGKLFSITVGEYVCYVNYASRKVCDELSYGDCIRVSGPGDIIEGPMNPGEFDRKRYFASDKIFFQVNAENVEILEHKSFSPGNFLYESRRLICDRVSLFCPVSSGTINALLLSERTDLDEYRKSIYRYVGIGHFLVISGLHISALGTFAYLLLRKFGLRIKPAGIITIVILLLYGALVEFSVSVARAIIMFIVRLIADMTGHSYDMMNAISFAVIVSIVINPLWTMDTGFIYSYATVTIISVYITQAPFRGKSKGFVGRLKSIMGLPIVLFVFMLPINLFLSYECSLTSVVANSILMPLSAPLLLAAFLACMSSVMGLGFLASAFDFSVSALLKLFDWLCGAFSELKFLGFSGRPMLLTVCLFYFLALFIIFYGKGLGRGIKFLLFLCLIQFLSIRAYIPNVSMLCVGQGDCAVIRTGSRSAVVIDCGSSDKTDMAGKILVPYLKYNGIDTIDALFVSHGDMDHCGGASYLLCGMDKNSKVFTGIKVSRLILPKVGMGDENLMLLSLYKEAVQAGTKVYCAKAGDSFSINEWEFLCAWPDVERLSGDSNEDSMVLLASKGQFDVLFTGDAPKEKELCALEYLNITEENPVEVLKVSHHGSKTASSLEFFNLIGAKTATISAGKNNRYGHPHKETLTNLKKSGYEIYRTDKQGFISIDIHKKNYSVTTK